MKEKLRLAVFGHKRWSREGGVEIVVKELCTRMAQQGCQVTCYNRSGHHVSGAEYDDAGKTEYEGIRQKSVPTIERRGYVYYTVPIDHNKAGQWFSLAAEKGNKDAEDVLRNHLRYNRFTKKWDAIR